jgi:hypothetical protein
MSGNVGCCCFVLEEISYKNDRYFCFTRAEGQVILHKCFFVRLIEEKQLNLQENGTDVLVCFFESKSEMSAG